MHTKIPALLARAWVIAGDSGKLTEEDMRRLRERSDMRQRRLSGLCDPQRASIQMPTKKVH